MLGLICFVVLAATAPGLTAEANALAKAGRTHEARLLMEQAFLLAPADLPVLAALARLREDDGDFPGAIEALDSFLALQSSGPEATDAEKHLIRLKNRVRPIPESARAAYARAGAFLRQSRTSEGVNELLQAELLAPHWLEVLSWLATYYEQNGPPVEAMPRLRRLMAIATDAELVKLQARLAEIEIRAADVLRAERAREESLAADKARKERDAAARAAREREEQTARERAQQEAIAEAARKAQADAVEVERIRKEAELEAKRDAERSRAATRRLGVGVVAVGAAAFVATAVFEGLAVDAEGKVKNGGLADSQQIQSTVAANNTFSSVALATAIGGGVLVGSGLLIYLLSREAAAPPVSIGVVPGGAVLLLEGTFP